MSKNRVKYTKITDEKFQDLLKSAKCPSCKSFGVLLPNKGIRAGMSEKADVETDPIVVCADMGHWAGNLSDCF